MMMEETSGKVEDFGVCKYQPAKRKWSAVDSGMESVGREKGKQWIVEGSGRGQKTYGNQLKQVLRG